MKKSLFMLGVAVAALSSCSQSEILEVAEGRAIGFSSFVNNNTRAVTEVTQLTSSDIYVIGFYGKDELEWNGKTYQNEPGSNKYYWEAEKFYRFGAYANGSGGMIPSSDSEQKVTFNPSESQLIFNNYTPNDQNDLVATIAEVETGSDVQSQENVELSFKHMLAQVELVFTTDAADIYELKIKDVKINGAISKANGTCQLKNGKLEISWQDGSKSDYTYDDETFVGVDIADSKLSIPSTISQAKLVIPQSLPTEDGEEYTVTFTATLKNGNTPDASEISKNFTAKLNYKKTGNEDLKENFWTPGYRYRYTAKISADMIDGNLDGKEIEFNPTIESWQSVDAGNIESTSQSGN